MADDPRPALSDKQLAELHKAVRHLGRAQGALHRARVLTGGGGFSKAPEWLLALEDAGTAVTEASNRLIDGLEAAAVPNG